MALIRPSVSTIPIFALVLIFYSFPGIRPLLFRASWRGSPTLAPAGCIFACFFRLSSPEVIYNQEKLLKNLHFQTCFFNISGMTPANGNNYDPATRMAPTLPESLIRTLCFLTSGVYARSEAPVAANHERRPAGRCWSPRKIGRCPETLPLWA